MTVLEIPADEYHQDAVADQPCLSASIANLLLQQSPAHARANHPKLSPQLRRRQEEKFDVGVCCHTILLEGRNAVQVIDAPDWRTKDAKALRENAREHGLIPLLEDQWREVELMLDAVRTQIPELDVDPLPFTHGKPEQTFVWEEDGVTLKARIDWLTNDNAQIWDLKTTSRSANPRSWGKTLFGAGYDVQAVMYRRGVRAVTGVTPEWSWLVAETQPPYAIAPVGLAPDAMAIAEDKLEYAIRVWRECLEADEWPSYPRRVSYVEAPGWMENAWLEQREAA